MNKNILILGLLLIIIVIGGVVLNKSQTGEDYFNWVKSAFLSNSFIAGITPNMPFQDYSEDLGLDFSEMNLENLLSSEGIAEGEGQIISDKVETEEQSKRNLGLEEVKVLSLAEIEEEINIIKSKTNKIDKEINRLKTLIEIQENINGIARETNILAQEIENIDELTLG